MAHVFADTTPEAEAVLFSLLRTASPARKLRMVNQLNAGLQTLMRSGLRHRFPQAGEAELRHHLAELLLGTELADQVEHKAKGVPPHRMHEQATEVTLAVTAVLERLEIPYVLVGSLASAVHGAARATLDSDLVAAVELQHIPALVDALRPDFYISAPAIAEAIEHAGSFNLIHFATWFKVDIFVPKPRAFDQAQLLNGRLMVIAEAPDRAAVVASAEDTILAKLEWYQAEGQVSERQWQDVLAVVKAQGHRLDLAYLRRHAPELRVETLPEEVLAGLG